MAVHPHPVQQHHIHPPSMPRTILRLNALTATALAALTLFVALPFADALGVDRSVVLAVFGVLVVYGVDALAAANGRRFRRMQILPFAVADAALVAASVAFLIAGPASLTPYGRAAIAIVGVIFAWFSFAGFRAAREL